MRTKRPAAISGTKSHSRDVLNSSVLFGTFNFFYYLTIPLPALYGMIELVNREEKFAQFISIKYVTKCSTFRTRVAIAAIDTDLRTSN